jgi:hypothetical protein
MTKNQTLIFIAATILCVSLAGCTSQSVEPLGGGYEYVTYTQRSLFMEEDAHQIALQYRQPNGKVVMIWPSAPWGYAITDSVAIFVGDINSERPKFGEPWPMERRLFAVKPPEPPLNITDEVLWQWSKKNKIDFEKALESASVVSVGEKGSQLEIRFAFALAS